ncbi:hypothetical protein DQE84_17195, partial [Staphylococcus warneri]
EIRQLLQSVQAFELAVAQLALAGERDQLVLERMRVPVRREVVVHAARGGLVDHLQGSDGGRQAAFHLQVGIDARQVAAALERIE